MWIEKKGKFINLDTGNEIFAQKHNDKYHIFFSIVGEKSWESLYSFTTQQSAMIKWRWLRNKLGV